MTIRFQSFNISNYKGWHEVKSEEREQSCFALSHDERFLAVPCGSVIKFFDLSDPSTDRALTKAREDNRQWPEEFRLQDALIREVSFSMSAAADEYLLAAGSKNGQLALYTFNPSQTTPFSSKPIYTVRPTGTISPQFLEFSHIARSRGNTLRDTKARYTEWDRFDAERKVRILQNASSCAGAAAAPARGARGAQDILSRFDTLEKKDTKDTQAQKDIFLRFVTQAQKTVRDRAKADRLKLVWADGKLLAVIDVVRKPHDIWKEIVEAAKAAKKHPLRKNTLDEHKVKQFSVTCEVQAVVPPHSSESAAVDQLLQNESLGGAFLTLTDYGENRHRLVHASTGGVVVRDWDLTMKLPPPSDLCSYIKAGKGARAMAMVDKNPYLLW